ncbi:LamG domain-containing protein [Parapedobacter koreensis]|uniref:Concanavalin A-like lectin/glucanases superfamily protein n=1 Tax=Parapedobacter koreensis TaxID=332977 RepID=A0A1H7PX67_9SPHI|nr:LamG domain-containing protein [Parapedobacter koreensis]SEL40332.1 Concanavalin A-like lectin/glucanases superfamily protein [Parapedobacter koreensis]
MTQLRRTFLWWLIACTVHLSISGCQNEKPNMVTLDLDCMMAHLEDMQQIIDTAQIGDVDGTFPAASAVEFQAAIDTLKTGISKAKAGYFVLPFQINAFCVNADKAIASFMNAYQTTLEPGTPAELQVFGIDNKGYIDFGESPEYGGSKRFTVEAWLKYDPGFFEFAIGDFIATFSHDGNGIKQGWMVNFSGANLRTTLGMGPQQDRVLEWGAAYPTNYGQWNHIVAVYDESFDVDQLKMYINGELLFAKTNDIIDGAGALQKYQPNTRNLKMWAFVEPEDNNRNMTGYIRKFRLWSTAKSQSDIKSLMAGDVSGNEANLICAWDFTEVPQDPARITDKTGRFTAELVGQYKWHKLEQ